MFFLELKDSLSRMGSDLKQGFISSLKSAWQTLNEFARAHTSSTQLQAELEKVANQIKEEEEKQVVEGMWTHFFGFIIYCSPVNGSLSIIALAVDFLVYAMPSLSVETAIIV